MCQTRNHVENREWKLCLLGCLLVITAVGCGSVVDTAEPDAGQPDAGVTCANTTCDANATCHEADGAPVCICNAGYAGNGTFCQDVDECAAGTHLCDPLATCANTGGSYTCTCPGGYEDTRGNGIVCAELDECAEELDGCDPVASCTNTEGSYTCACPGGYADVNGNGTSCTEIDECQSGMDDCPVFCVNTLGSYQCVAPATCAELRSLDPVAQDGEHTLYIQNDPTKPWTAYCHDMVAAPREYLTLSGENFSEYAVSSTGEGPVQTQYRRIRVDPATLTVDIGDQTFASSFGSLMHGTTRVTSMPFGVAMSCRTDMYGKAAISLDRTPFALAEQFCQGGASAVGSVEFSPDKRRARLLGKGYCGWTAPSPCPFNPFNATGGYLLDLTYSPAPTP